MKVNRFLNKENKKYISRYIIISIVGYSIIFFGLYLFIDVLKVNKTISFLIVYAFNYMFLYMVQLKYLFMTNHNSKKMIRFLIYLFFSYLIATLLFFVLTSFNLQYLIATVLTVIILFPLKLFVLKKVVYKA